MESSVVRVFDDSGWKGSEELALLEAVELYGFGNWEDTAALVGKNRSPEQVRDHFITHYVKGCVGKVAWKSVTPDTYSPTDHTCSRNGQLSPSLTAPLPVIPELTLAEQQHLGYMPKRDDFEREFDNEVEMLISTLRISPHDEDELDVDLKVAHIDMYNRRLRERFRKKAVVREYGLVSLFYKSLEKDEEVQALLNPGQYCTTSSLGSGCDSKDLSSISARLTSDNQQPSTNCPSSPSPYLTPSKSGNSSSLHSTTPKKKGLSPTKSIELFNDRFKDQLRDKFKILSQFQSALDQKQLIENLKREKELRIRIKDLIRFRKNGIKRLCDVPSFESARNKRDKRKENKKKGANTVSGHKGPVTVATSPTLTSSSVTSKCSMGMASPAKEALTRNSPSSAKCELLASPSTPPAFNSYKSDPVGPLLVAKGDTELAGDLPSIQAKCLKEFDINSMPSARLLSDQEKRICTTLRLTPSQYIAIKGLMIKEKSLPKKQKSGLENLDGRIRRRLQRFFIGNGWISN